MPPPRPVRGRRPQREVRHRGPAVVAVWSLLLVLALPTVILMDRTAPTSPALLLQCVVVAHTGAALAMAVTDLGLRMTAFGFWLFSYIWLGLAPLAMLATDTYPWPFRTDAGTAFQAVAVVEAGLLAYTVGDLLGGLGTASRRGALESLLSRRVAPLRVLGLCVLALGIAAVLVPRQGGVGTFFTSRQAVSQAAQAAQGYGGDGGKADRALAAWGLSVPAFWALLALVHIPRHRRGDRLLKGARLLLLPVLLALNAVVNNPVSQPRFWAGTVLLTLGFAAPRLRRPRVFRIAAAGVLATVLVVFPYSDYFRYTHREQITVESPARQFSTNGDYDAYQQVLTGLAYVKETGFHPVSALGPPLFWVPRTVWAGKPPDTGVELAGFAGYNFTNLSAPLWIESYIWGGLPCVIGVFALLGALSRRIDRVRYRLRDDHGTIAATLVPAFAFYQLVMLRGSLLAVAAPLAMLVAIPFLVTTGKRAVARVRSAADPLRRPGRARGAILYTGAPTGAPTTPRRSQ